jgi:hypothetical protein
MVPAGAVLDMCSSGSRRFGSCSCSLSQPIQRRGTYGDPPTASAAYGGGLVEALPGLNCEGPQPFQFVQQLGLMVPELPHQRGSLVLEQIAALSDEHRPPMAVQQLTSGGNKGLHGTLPDA